jgi:osmotically-inducible protein OsmY
MRSTKWLCLGGLALVVLSALPGCATFNKCGFAGCAGDARITAEVQALFNRHPALQPPNEISIQTLDHVVYLNGLVDTDMEQRLAGEVALGAPGVVRVVNSIAVRGNGW